MAKVVEGAPAPDFELESAAGPIRLSDFNARTLVLYFYPKDDTSGCTSEAKDFSALAPAFAAAGAAIVGVSKDSVKSHEKFAAKYGLAIPLGADPQGKTVEAYESWIPKKLYGREYMGIDRSTFLIREGLIRRIWRKVKVAGHAQAVLDAVRAL